MRFEEFRERLRKSQRPVVVDVWAPWCGPCRTLSPRLEKVAESFAGQVDLWKLNADEAPELARELGVMGIPTLIFYRNGVEITRCMGVQSQEDLFRLFAMLLNEQVPMPSTPMSDATRWLRLLSGLALWTIASFSSWSPVLLIAGAILLFSAVYDRCPLWQTLRRRLR
ncbi:MAG: thioredoxin [Caldilinea sp.]|nr:thioredoxin [Caldilinea sp.]MDW8442640.1 thioredoxin [Caldilineaceae bacterium]